MATGTGREPETVSEVVPFRRRPSRAKLVGFGALIAFWFVAFCWLGTWQVHRLHWKRALIATVDARVHAVPVPAPGPAQWPHVDDLNYLHVALRGHYLAGKVTLTQAVSDYGPGAWMMTPFQTDRGFTVLVNRGFLPDDLRAQAGRYAAPAGETRVTGLLRLTEPKGGFLQRNHPERDEWHSRDVAAIAARRGLAATAPYFVDADADAGAASRSGGWPKGGLTVIRFPNNHLQYAITWYGLALMMIVCAVVLYRSERRPRADR